MERKRTNFLSVFVTYSSVWKCLTVFLLLFSFLFLFQNAYADNNDTLSIQVSDEDLGLTVLPMVGGKFSKSNDNTITVTSTNISGYNLTITSKDSTSMVNTNQDEVQSIGSAIDETTFSTSSTYNNKWGYKPSQYVNTVGGQNTTVQNSNYLPAPSTTTGDLLAATSSASASGGDNYTLSFGARADENLPLGSYEYTYVLTAVANLDTFPVVWSQMGECEFHGNAPSYITGSECSDYWDKYYIDTGIALNSQANASKDYEIHFKIDHYLPSENPTSKNDGQQTFVSSKVPSSTTIGSGSAPGLVVRRSAEKISFESKMNSVNPKMSFAASEVSEASIFRIDNKLYVSINNGPLALLHDLTGYNQYFDLTTWFGAYPATSGCDGSSAKPCTSAKRYIEADFSEMYIKLGDYDSSNLHNITFNANGGTPATTEYLVADGNALGTLPTTTRSDWVFGGWFTDQSSGTAISEQTVPSGNDTYWAHWYKSVTDADIDRTDFHLGVGDTGSIEVTNASIIEPYTLVSNDISVATVDQNTGVITAIGSGSTTITVTGTLSGDTRTIDVTVGDIITVNFDSQGGINPSYEWTIASGATFRELPAPAKTGYALEGWYTGINGTGTKLTTSTVIDSSSPTQYYANWEEVDYVCKIAEPNTLHTETCNQTGSSGCRGAGIASGATIEYGQLVSSTTMTAGDAYNCDINNDGDWDDVTERFYYFGSSNDNAKFIYYKNITTSNPAYSDALTYLPTSSDPDWDNPNLVTFTTGDYNNTVARFMTYPEALALCDNSTSDLGVNGRCLYLLENSAFANASGVNEGIWLEIQPSYKNRIQTKARSLTHNTTTANNEIRPTIEVPTIQVEPYVAPTYDITFDPHNETSSWTETINAGDTLGAVYPATNPIYSDHVFQGWFTAETGGTLVTSSMQPSGDATYHAQWLKTVALANITNTSISVDEGSTDTITITNASEVESYTLSSNDTSVATVDSNTGVVTGVSAGSTTITMTGLSGATRTINVTVTTPVPSLTIHFNSHGGAAVADRTINLGDSVGVPLPSAPVYDNNHLFQGWFTAATGGTQINGTETPSTETTYHAQWKKTVALADLASDGITVVEGQTATIVVNNASELEGYTFSSANSSVASVDANTGVITGHVESVTTITMTGTDSNQTKTIDVHVVAEQNSYVCKLAAAGTLHSANNITYGQIASNTTPQAGDAYDCDVDYDDIFDPLTERFYYLGTDSNTNAVLVAYNSYYNDAWAPGVSGSSGDSIFTYANALTQLPSNASGKWDNPYLIEQETGKAARFMEKTDVENACGGSAVTTQGTLVSCPYLMEHSGYDNGGRTALWLKYDGTKYWRIHSGSSYRNVSEVSDPNGSSNMARPAIVVPYDKIEKYVVPPVQMDTVTFNSMGGTSVSSTQVQDGTALGQEYPSNDPTKADNKFFGWYTDSNYTTEVTPDTVVNGDVTYYAKWVGDTTGFPIVFSETNECTFTGSAVTGTYCGHTSANQYYIDSDVQLFTATNNMYQKDFEIGLTIAEYSPSTSGLNNQATFVNSKQEATGYPGFVLRRSGDNVQLTAKFGNSGNPSDVAPSASTLKQAKIVRRDGKMYYAWNGADLTLWHDISDFSTRFDTEVWFGGATASDGTSAMRPLKGKLTDMYIRVGTYNESSSYTITFDGRGGTPSEGARSVNAGQQIGSLPTVTRAGSYSFVGWFDENNTVVTAATVPTRNETYHAVWSYTPSDTPVSFDTSNDAMKGYYNIIEGWANGSANISQFNKDTTTINNSTWGDTSVLSEANFQAGLKANFEAYDCDMQKSYNGDSESKWNWTSGSVNCSKPAVFDTGVNDALTVYLYDTNTSTVGNKVYYTKSENGTLTNLVPGKTYKWVQTSDNTVYGYVTATADHGTRFIDAGSTNNVRDLGGLEVDTDDDGVVDGTLKYEKLYRGGKIVGGSSGVEAITNLAKTSDNVAGDIIEYDVAGDQPGGFPSAKTYSVIHYDFDYDANNLTNYNAARNAINAIMDDVINGGKIYFHCRVGADRTGTTAYLLEGLLGVSDEDRYREYELTHLGGLTDRTRYYKQKADNNKKKFVFMMDYVLTKGDIMTWYMKGSSDTADNHPDQDRIDAFRQAMIE